MGRVMATPWEQPTQPLVTSYDLQTGNGSILLTLEPTRGQDTHAIANTYIGMLEKQELVQCLPSYMASQIIVEM